MADPLAQLVDYVAATFAVAIAATAGLRMWREWLDLKRAQIGHAGSATPSGPEIADLRQRIRRLESIACGEG